jgi:hypothetical protein
MYAQWPFLVTYQLVEHGGGLVNGLGFCNDIYEWARLDT